MQFFVFGLFTSSRRAGIIGLIVSIALCVGYLAFGHWYYANTASGIRAMKDQDSNYAGGLKRQVIVTAEDGREIYFYEGHIDVETKPENKYILFETEEGYRHMIYYGATDTVQILEIPE